MCVLLSFIQRSLIIVQSSINPQLSKLYTVSSPSLVITYVSQRIKHPLTDQLSVYYFSRVYSADVSKSND